MPIFFKRKLLGHSKEINIWPLIILFGFIGTLLQLSEFFGLYKGLPVATVTFLVYSHPIWSLILSKVINKEQININSLIKVILGIIGIYFIFIDAAGESIKFELRIILPILAGFLIALWSSLSNKIRKSGLDALEISFYYDLFAFFFLLLFIGISGELPITINNVYFWLLRDVNFLYMIIFSLLIGLLPNFLFYLGSGYVTNLNASLLLLIEPVIASLFAFFFYNEKCSPSFLIGALLVLSAGLDFDALKRKLISLKYLSLILFACIFLLYPLKSVGKQLFFIEFSPPNQINYLNSNEQNLLDKTIDLALENANKLFPKCAIPFQKYIKFGTDEELFSFINKNIQTSSDKTIILGLSRSLFAQIGAKATSNKENVVGLSIGASSTKFKSLNSNFFSVVSPLDSQLEVIKQKSLDLKCSKLSGVFDPNDALSSEIKFKFSSFTKRTIIEINSNDAELRIDNDIKNSDCVFVGLNFSKSSAVLDLLFKIDSVKYLFGTGDWSIYSEELLKILENQKKSKVKIFTPTGWMPSVSKNSLNYKSTLFRKYKLLANPIGAYAYDSILIGHEALCTDKSFKQVILHGKSKKHLLRNYTGISSSNNFLSKIYLIQWR